MTDIEHVQPRAYPPTDPTSDAALLADLNASMQTPVVLPTLADVQAEQQTPETVEAPETPAELAADDPAALPVAPPAPAE